MNRTILVVDVPNLCYRALYSSPDLSFHGIRTGVTYGTLRDIMDLRDTFSANMMVFCFDSRQSKRKEFYPGYKEGRHDGKTQKEEEIWKDMQSQMLDIRLKYLSRAGFSNILIANGYEADDVAASVVKFSIEETDSVVLVTGDKDYYQLLQHNVMLYDPVRKKRTTLQSFTKEWKFNPSGWPYMQSLCGCGTDCVPGVPGCGEVRAKNFVLNELDKIPKKILTAIKSSKGLAIRKRNLKLVKLPFEGTPVFELKPDNFNVKGWRSVCNELGMKSLMRYKQ